MASFDELKTALASSAEAVINVLDIEVEPGTPQFDGVWTEVQSDMERILPGAILLLKEAEGGALRFASVPPTGAFRVREDRLQVKISLDGTTVALA